MDITQLQSSCWCKRLSILSFAIILFFVTFSTSHTFFILIYCICVVSITFWAVCSFVNNILKQSQPLILDVPFTDKQNWFTWVQQIICKLYSRSQFIQKFLKRDNVPSPNKDKIKNTDQSVRRKKIKSFDPLLNTVDGRVRFMTETVTQKFILAWYKAISLQDELFIDESKVLLDALFKRLLLVIPFIDTDRLVLESLAVILRHLKEFHRAKKRLVRQNTGDIESLYRYALPQNIKDENLKIHAHKITVNVMREFITWELWNSFPCNILVSVLSNKLTLNIINCVSDPNWLLKTLYNLLNPSSVKSDPDKVEETTVPSSVSVTNSPLESSETRLIHREKPAEVIYFSEVDSSRPDKSNDTAINDVDIIPLVEEPLAESEDKNIPLILDNTDSLDWSHFSLNKPLTEDLPTSCTVTYKTIDPNVKEYQSTDIISPSTWNVEDFDFISMGQDLLAQTSELNLFGKHLWNFSADSEIDVTPKKTEAGSDGNLTSNKNVESEKGGLSAVSMTAITKEIQQRSAASVSDAMHKIGDLQDEAAGYVEGIIDFGMAGLKKGLRLTGLQDNTPSVRLTRTSPRLEEKVTFSSSIGDDTDSNKHGRSSDELDDSPEYEEPVDLASSVAKLKSIIAQRTSGESSANTPAVSPLMGDTDGVSLAYEPGAIGNKQPLADNLFARVTGVFNTIRTALPGNVGDIVPQATPTLHPMNQRWVYIESHLDDSENLNKLIEVLLTERSDFCNVDTAYEAMDNSDFPDGSNKLTTRFGIEQPEVSYDDDLDECFSNIPKSHLLMDIFCELLKDTMNCTAQEPIVRSLLLLFGNQFEDVISNFSKSLVHKSDSIDSLLRNISVTTAEDICDEDLINVIENKIPGLIQNAIGKDDIRNSIKFFLESLKYKSINRDICVLLLEILTTRLIQSNIEISPK